MSEQPNGNGKQPTVLQHEAAVSVTMKMRTKTGGDVLFTVRSGATPTMVEQALQNFVHGVVFTQENYEWTPFVDVAYTPAINGAPAPAAQPAQAQAPEGEAPLCNLHNRAMKASQFGGWYCTAKNEDGSYCVNKVGAG